MLIADLGFVEAAGNVSGSGYVSTSGHAGSFKAVGQLEASSFDGFGTQEVGTTYYLEDGAVGFMATTEGNGDIYVDTYFR
jgi:hypothetical protein